MKLLRLGDDDSSGQTMGADNGSMKDARLKLGTVDYPDGRMSGAVHQEMGFLERVGQSPG